MDRGQAHAARVLAAITFHFDAHRLGFLAEVLRALAEYPVQAMDVVILTNTSGQDELELLRRLCGETMPAARTSVRTCRDLPTRWHLTWCHKELIAKEFVHGNADRYTHFIYLESDIRLSFENFCYFIEFREVLRGFGLLPAFVRVEYNTELAGFTTSDLFWPIYVPVQNHVLIGDTVFLNVPNPYNPFYILDLDLAAEYVRSRSFEEEGSRQICRWGLAERAALGLCLENVPAPFHSRYVVPVSRSTGITPAAAWVWHLPNNYANNRNGVLGKVRMDQLFAGACELRNDGAWREPHLAGFDHGNRFSRLAEGRQTSADKAEREEIGGARLDEPVTTDFGALLAPERNTEDQYHLLSHHDTILFVDTELKRLRHAPFGIAPLNLIIEVQGGRGRLVAKGTRLSGNFYLSFSEIPGEVSIQTDGTAVGYPLEPCSDQEFGVRIGERYLGADLRGVVLSNKVWLRDWERFRLLRADTLDGIALLRRYLWVSHQDRRIVSLAAQPIDFGREHPPESDTLAATLGPHASELRRGLVFGPARLQLVGKNRSIIVDRSEPSAGEAPARVNIVDISCTSHDFSRFAPLICYRTSGDEASYDRLRLSLYSLEKFGCYSGAVNVTSDRPRGELLKYVPRSFHQRIIHSPPEDGSFKANDSAGALLDAFQPLLFCDLNVVFDTDINDFLIDMLLCDRSCCTANIGFIAFKNAANFRASDILSKYDPHSSGFRPPPGLEADLDILEKYCRLATQKEHGSAGERRGLIQFKMADNQFEALANNSMMRTYIELLNYDAGHKQKLTLESSLPGLLDEPALAALAELAQRIPGNSCVVEVGSLFGQSSRILAKNAFPSVTIYCLDAWERDSSTLPLEEKAGRTLSIDAFRKNTSDFSNIIPLQGHSPRHFIGWQRPIHLFFANGIHSNPALRQNLTFWARFVRPGGFICGSGYSDDCPDVKAEVDRLAAALEANVEISSTFWRLRVVNAISCT